jgi:hypothetical protein
MTLTEAKAALWPHVDRRQHLVTLPDGSIVDETAIREWLNAMDRRNERVTVLRLAELDPMLTEFARTSRRPR